MNQAEVEMQLKVWKELAVSKQMLMKGATDALGLNPDCSANDLKAALDASIQKGKEADNLVRQAREDARRQIEAMEKQVKASEKSQKAADALRDDALSRLERFERDMAAERQAHIAEMKTVKAQLADRERDIKAIHKALADTPDNVVKKLKQLKKQKAEEADARKQLEAQVASLRKDKRKTEEKLTAAQEALKSAEKLVEQYKDVRSICEDLKARLAGTTGEQDSELPALPVLDEDMLKAIVEAAQAAQK